MFRQQDDGTFIEVLDDERITPEMKSLRDDLNTFLGWLQSDDPRRKELERQFREGRLSDTPGFDWYKDPQ